MITWGLADDIAVVVLVFGAVNMYLSYGLTRMTGGAPRAWYVIISAFAVLFIRGAAELYFDVQTPVGVLDIEEQTILLIVVILFSIGLFLLTKTFRKQMDPGQRSS
jgi:hypothetical protein